MEHQEFAVGWFTLSLVIAGIAQGKNRSGLGWWLLGFFLGPLALLILLFLDRGIEDSLRGGPPYSAMEERLAARISDEVRKFRGGPSSPA